MIALCIYECLRLVFLVGAFILIQPVGVPVFPWLALITPGAMFQLTALFWLLDISRYRVLSPLYLAGKTLSIITTSIWLFYAITDIIKELILGGMALFIVPGIVSFLILGDLLSIRAAIKITKSRQAGLDP